MSYGRFKGGQHFSKKALKDPNTISPAQIKRFKAFGYNLKAESMSYDKAAHVLNKLEKAKSLKNTNESKREDSRPL